MVNNIVKLNGLLILYHNKRDCSAFCPTSRFSIDKLNVGISTADHARRRTLAMGHEAVTCPSTWSPWSSADVWMNCRLLPLSSSGAHLGNLLPDVSSGTPGLRGHICKLHKQLFEQCIQDELQWSLEEEGRQFVQTAAEDQRQRAWTCDSFVVLGLDEACYLSALGQAEHSRNIRTVNSCRGGVPNLLT